MDAAAELAGHVVMTRGRRAKLQPDHGRVLIERLKTKDAGTVDKSLRPCGIIAQFGGGGIESLEGMFLRNVGGDGDVDKGLRPIAAEIPDGADIAVGKSDQCTSRIADHSPPQG